MGKQKTREAKTNVTRLLDIAGIEYKTMEYEVDENDLSGSHAADLMGVEHGRLFKTLVLHGDKSGYIVIVIPVDDEIDLKKAARASANKHVEMLPMKDLLPVTGYIRGGCSPIGMKKLLPTYIHESAKELDTIGVSAGKRGVQVILNPLKLAGLIHAVFADVISD